MTKVNLELVGEKALVKMLAEAGARAVPAIKQALHEEGQIMFRHSQRIVPVDTGTLRRSGQILPPVEEGGKIVLVMGYGGAASAYALRQHEDLTYRHKEGKQAKYLEAPVRERANNLPRNILERVRRVLSS
jgi:hypothetical protein